MLIECDICNKLDNCLIFDTGRGLIRICNKCQFEIYKKIGKEDIFIICKEVKNE
jgi:hypothetical protein